MIPAGQLFSIHPEGESSAFLSVLTGVAVAGLPLYLPERASRFTRRSATAIFLPKGGTMQHSDFVAAVEQMVQQKVLRKRRDGGVTFDRRRAKKVLGFDPFQTSSNPPVANPPTVFNGFPSHSPSFLSVSQETLFKAEIPEPSVKDKDVKDSRIKVLIDLFFTRQHAALKERPTNFPGGAAAKGFKRLLAHVSYEEIDRRMTAWFASTDNFVQRNGWSVTQFLNFFNRLKDGPLMQFTNGYSRPGAVTAKPGKYDHLRVPHVTEL